MPQCFSVIFLPIVSPGRPEYKPASAGLSAQWVPHFLTLFCQPVPHRFQNSALSYLYSQLSTYLPEYCDNIDMSMIREVY